jgi:hypothetical protein
VAAWRSTHNGEFAPSSAVLAQSIAIDTSHISSIVYHDQPEGFRVENLLLPRARGRVRVGGGLDLGELVVEWEGGRVQAVPSAGHLGTRDMVAAKMMQRHQRSGGGERELETDRSMPMRRTSTSFSKSTNSSLRLVFSPENTWGGESGWSRKQGMGNAVDIPSRWSTV